MVCETLLERLNKAGKKKNILHDSKSTRIMSEDYVWFYIIVEQMHYLQYINN